MKDFIRKNSLVLSRYFILLAVSLYFIFSYEKYSIHLYINQYVGNKYLNAFFYYITYLGDGALAVFILLVILFLNVRLGVYAAVSFLSAALVATILKRLIFEDVNRPSFIFQWIEKRELKLVEDVELYIHNSFPSGHATQAFAILMCLVFASSNRFLQISFFILALLTSFSRVYLSQHWLVDITAGSMIGVAFSALWYFVFMNNDKFSKLNKPLLDLKKA